MAEHVRNEFARAAIPIRPSRVLTLAKFLEPFVVFQETPDSLLNLLIAQLPLSGFSEAAGFRGFHRALASVIQEIPANNLPADLARIAFEIDYQLATLGRALREKRLRTAVPTPTGPIIIDGFFTFAPSELAFIENLASQTSVTVTLPDWPGSSAARAHLLHSGFTEQRLDHPLRQPVQVVFAAPSLEHEVEQIALRIIEHHARGRQWREMGILLRAKDPYAAALESTFARFGIPARFHFAGSLADHPAIQYLAGIIRVLLTGWDHASLLTLLRMPINGFGATPEADRLDFAMRESLPARGAPKPSSPGPLSAIAALASWSRDRLPPTEWSARLKTLRSLIPPPEITDQLNPQQLQIWTSTATALDVFETALDTTALALGDARLSLAKFWPHAEASLEIEKLRVPDHRRNVVHVLDVYEARQWELSVAFIPGLTERHFPQYHRENPLLPDPARTRDRQQEEQFLFHFATTRATQETVLSYPRFNSKGDATLRSFFLPEEAPRSSATRILPKPAPIATPHLPSNAPELRIKHACLSSSSIESFLQCPFQFFGRKTLKLRKRPEKPRDRLNPLLQGIIVHQAIAQGSFDAVFDEVCRDNNIPPGYRTEAVRLEVLRNFEAFQADRQWPLTWPSLIEQEFLVALTPELSIAGRIDRLDTGPGNQAIVIDYKYSAAARIRDRVSPQAGIYLLAAERAFGLEPAGMFYCALREPISWEGWHVAVPGLQLGESRTPAALRELIIEAEQGAIQTWESIVSGNMEVRPADTNKCRYCDYRDICRVESISHAAPAL